MYLSRSEIAARVEELGEEIARDYAGRDLVLVTLLKGAFVFASDFTRALRIPHAMDFLVLAGYGGNLGGRSRIRVIKDLELPIGGCDVLLVENVVDTGLTLNYVVKTLSLRAPRDLAICSLFDRPYRRLVDDLPMRYVGFTLPDEFYVGYGFHLNERFRGLPDVHVLEHEN